jgi:hypothetical protein
MHGRPIGLEWGSLCSCCTTGGETATTRATRGEVARRRSQLSLFADDVNKARGRHDPRSTKHHQLSSPNRWQPSLQRLSALPLPLTDDPSHAGIARVSPKRSPSTTPSYHPFPTSSSLPRRSAYATAHLEGVVCELLPSDAALCMGSGTVDAAHFGAWRNMTNRRGYWEGYVVGEFILGVFNLGSPQGLRKGPHDMPVNVSSWLLWGRLTID